MKLIIIYYFYIIGVGSAGSGFGLRLIVFSSLSVMGRWHQSSLPKVSSKLKKQARTEQVELPLHQK